MSFLRTFTATAIACLALSAPAYALAASPTISLTPSNAVFSGDSSVGLSVLLSTGNEPINAVEGVLVYPGIIQPTEIVDGNSLITYWVEEPSLKRSVGSIHFKGLIAGGLSVENGFLFKVLFKANNAALQSEGIIKVQEVHVFRNDGKGTQIDARAGESSFRTQLKLEDTTSASHAASSTQPRETIDPYPPTDFNIAVSHHPSLFDDKWFIAFSARDADSGIDHYEIQESKQPTPDDNRWEKVVSPYKLRDQSLASYIHVRVFDKKNNFNIITKEPKGESDSIYLLPALFLAVFLIICIVVWRVQKRNKQRVV